MPIKDRYPPAAFDPADSRRRLMILVDGSMVSNRSYNEMLPRIVALGQPMLTRVFSHDLKPDWQPDVIGRRVEWFRVEKFIPIHMQIAADAAHVNRWRRENHTEAFCFMVADAEVEQYAAYFDRPDLDGVNLYCFGEHDGLRKKLEVDGRMGDGSKQAKK